jgi:hypothetical protein
MTKHLTTIFVSLLLTASALACKSETDDLTGLSESDVLEKLRPSMVTVRDELGYAGSGFLVDQDYVITAAHIVWPRRAVTVAFEDGTEHTDVPVISYDLMADLAFLGPLQTSAPHLAFADDESKSVGGTAYSVGHSQETPELIANKGECCAFKKWSAANVSSVYTTARVGSGMSGGALTNGKGEVIGIITLAYEDGSGGPSSVTIRDRLSRIIDGEKTSVVGSRLPTEADGVLDHTFVLHDRWDTATFVYDEPFNTQISIEFDGAPDTVYAGIDPHGWTQFDGFHGMGFLSTTGGAVQVIVGYGGPAFIVVKQRFDLEREVTIRSTVPLVRHTDPDDGRELKFGDTVIGVFDTPVDIDTYTIHLSQGQRLGIRLRSDGASGAMMTVDYPGAAYYEVVSMDEYDESRTVDGVVIEYEAPVDGQYTVAVEPTRLQSPVGYTLEVVSRFSNGSPVRFEKPENAFDSPVGDLMRFQAENSPIRIDYPANITGGGEEVLGAALFEQGRRGETVALEERDLSFYEEELSIDQYIRRSVLMSGLPLVGEKATTRRELKTPSGTPVVIEDFVADGGQTKGVRLAYIHEGTTGFMAVFYSPAEVFEEWKPVVDYSVGTFAVFGETVGE